jgi:arylsulfatase A-like enzyme
MRIHTNLDALWMAPMANAIVFVIVAAALSVPLALIAARMEGKTKLAIVSGALVTLALWSLVERVPQVGSVAAAILSIGGGIAAAGALRRRDRVRTPIDRALIPLGVTVVALMIGIVGSGLFRERRGVATLRAAAAGAPNVLLLIFDTVRAQSTSVTGYNRSTTPTLEALADSGARFDRAFSTAPWTVPSHASMFTGRYPHELSADWLSPLDDADSTIAEVLRDAGYVTGAFVANYMIAYEVGLNRGFVHYEDYLRHGDQFVMNSSLASWLAHWPRLRRVLRRYDHVNRKTAPEVNAAALRWIRKSNGRPYFAFLNYFDAHSMYLPPAPFATMFGPDTARKNWRIGFPPAMGGIGLRLQREQMKPREAQAELDAYEAAIAFIDSNVRALLDSLRTSGALANTIVIVSSDHGEHFGEHRAFLHGNTLYPQLLHVPLVIWSPGRVPARQRISDYVTLRDLAATIERMALGTSRLPGSSLQVYWDADSATKSASAILSSRTIATSKPIPDSMRHGAWSAVIDDKLVIEFVGGRQPGTEVFDLRADSLATHAIAPGNAPNVKAALDSAQKLYRGLRWKSRASPAGRPSPTAGGSR